MEYIELIENCIFQNPLALLSVSNQDSLMTINSYMPFSVGFEIECNALEDVELNKSVIEEFRSIPFIMHADINNYGEIRFRIPKGINGFICLYYISKKLKKYFGLNPLSGIHYHVGVEDYPFRAAENRNFILDELSSWGYVGTYNAKNVASYKGNWVRYPTALKTVEYRIGEMTFDYEVLVKRIVHCCYITREVIEKGNKIKVEIPFYEFDREFHLAYLKINNKSSIFAKISSIEDKIKKLLDESKQKNMFDTNLENTLVKTRIIKI